MKEWENDLLGNLCRIVIGRTPSRSNLTYWDTKKQGSCVWLSIADLNRTEKGIVSDSSEYVSTEGAMLCKKVVKGTLLVSFKLTLGRIAFAGCDLFTNEAIAALEVRNEQSLSKLFLAYFLKYFDWFEAAKNDEKLLGMTFNKEKLKAIKVPIPSKEEQERIVAILDQAFAGIAVTIVNVEASIKKARAYFAASLGRHLAKHNALGIEKVLGDIADVQSGGTPPVSMKSCWGGKIPWYSSGELNTLETAPSKRFVTEEGIAKSNAKLFPKGSLLIGMYDTAALKMSILDREATFNQAIAGVKPNDTLDLFFVLHSINAKKEALLQQRRGTRQMNLSLAKIKEISLKVPPRSVQRQLVDILRDDAEVIADLVDVYEAKLASLAALKQSLLHQAFSGNL